MVFRWIFNFRNWQPTKEEWTLCNQCIQLEERCRIQKFVFKKDAKAAMAGRLLMRKALIEYYNLKNQNIQLGRTIKGKPYFMNPPDSFASLCFNVSHHGKYAVLAAQPLCKIGIDVMEVEERQDLDDFFHTMRKQFTADEWQFINSPSSNNGKLSVFYRLWCLKESYVKAIGTGIGFEVKRLNFRLNKDNVVPNDKGMEKECTELTVDDVLVTDWVFEEHFLDNHCIAVAVQKELQPGSKIEKCTEPFKEMTVKDVLQNMEIIDESDDTFWEIFSNKAEKPQKNL